MTTLALLGAASSIEAANRIAEPAFLAEVGTEISQVATRADDHKTARSVNTVMIGEAPFRVNATRIVTPDYPRGGDLARHQGLAVAEVVANTRGDMESVQVIDAPSRDVARSLKRALRQWKVKPLTVDGKHCRMRAKITYEFRLVDGQGRVLTDPDAVVVREYK